MGKRKLVKSPCSRDLIGDSRELYATDEAFGTMQQQHQQQQREGHELFEVQMDGTNDFKKKKNSVSAKRAEQNRIAQRNFRDKQLQKQREMTQKMEFLERLEKENKSIKLELNSIKTERENLIHLMDKLRSENMCLYDSKLALEKKIKNGCSTSYGARPVLAPSPYHQQPIVKGNFGLITRPPPFPVNHTLPAWTSHKNTFIDTTTLSNSANLDSGSVLSNSENSSVHEKDSSSSIEVAVVSSLPPQKTYPIDNNNYPGFPSWTPPMLAHPADALDEVMKRRISSRIRTKSQKEAREKEKYASRLPPNPLPYHLSFSYTDTKTSHNICKPPTLPPEDGLKRVEDGVSNSNVLFGEGFHMIGGGEEKTHQSIEDANFNALASLFATLPHQQQQPIPLQPPLLFLDQTASLMPNQHHPMHLPIMYPTLPQTLYTAETRPMWMPFMPSTNAMVPLYHHVPFESLGGENLLFSTNSQQGMAFGPLVMGTHGDGGTAERLENVFLPH